MHRAMTVAARVGVVLALAVASGLASMAAQAPAQVTGIVTDSHGQPIADSIVTMAGRGGPQMRAVVDARGRFVFRGLPPGAFTLQATRPGYVGGGLNQRQPFDPPQPMQFSPAAPPSDLRLQMWKLGVVGGSITGPGREPISGIEVHALRRTLLGGQWRLVDLAVATSDDHGRYRLSGLQPGDYRIAAVPPRTRETSLWLATLNANPLVAADAITAMATSGADLTSRSVDYSLAYWTAPVAASATASSDPRGSIVSVGFDRERLDVDFALVAARLVHVSGVVSGAEDHASGLVVHLVPASHAADESTPLDAASAACDESGHFTIAGVLPGSYVASVQFVPAAPPQAPGAPGAPAAQPLLPTDPVLWGKAQVTVGTTDVKDVAIAVRRGFHVTGRVQLDGASLRADIGALALRLDPIDQPTPTGNAPTWRARVDGEGRIESVNVPPGKFLLRAIALPRGLTVWSAMIGGRDVLDEPIDLTAADQSDLVVTLAARGLPGIVGTVHDAADQPAPDAMIAIFPADRSRWIDSTSLARRFRLVRPLPTGGFGVANLPPGEYLAVASTSIQPMQWQDPSSLGALVARATTFTVDSAVSTTLNLRVIK